MKLRHKVKAVICCAFGLVGTMCLGWSLQWSTGAPLFEVHGRWSKANPKSTNAEGWIHFLGLCARAIELGTSYKKRNWTHGK